MVFPICILQKTPYGPITAVSLARFKNGERDGTVQVSRKLLPDGGVREAEAAPLAKSKTVIIAGDYNREGVNTRTWMELDIGDVEAVFNEESVDMFALIKGKKGRKKLPYPSGLKRGPSPIYWFWREHPVVGATETFAGIDWPTMKVKAITSTYIGDEVVHISGNRSVRGHKVSRSDGWLQWYDDKGWPLRLQYKNYTYERIN